MACAAWVAAALPAWAAVGLTGSLWDAGATSLLQGLIAAALFRLPCLQVPPADVVIIEGILVLHMEEIRAMLNMKVYVDTDDDVRLARRCEWGSWGSRASGEG